MRNGVSLIPAKVCHSTISYHLRDLVAKGAQKQPSSSTRASATMKLIFVGNLHKGTVSENPVAVLPVRMVVEMRLW